MDKQYCTVEDIENYLGIDVALEFQSQIDGWIEAMSNLVSLRTNREWLVDTTATDRYFDGNGCQNMEVGDFVGVPTVSIGDSFGENMEVESDFVTFPHNTTVKNTIILKSGIFSKKIKNVLINVKWGYANSVPEDIKQATVILTSGIILAQTNQDGEIESEKIGNYSVKYVTESQKSDYNQALDIINSRKVIRI